MRVIPCDLDVYVGAAYNGSILCYQDTAATQPFDFTDYDGEGAAFDDFGDSASICTINLNFNSNPADGELLINIPKANTVTLTPGNYVWDGLLWASSGADEEVWIRGAFHVHPQGTRRS